MSNDSIEAIGSVDKKKGADKGGEAGGAHAAASSSHTQQTSQAQQGGDQAQESKGVEGINTQDTVQLSSEAQGKEQE